MEITEQGVQSWWMKMRNAEWYLKGATLTKQLRLADACSKVKLPELASKLERLDCSRWFFFQHRREYQSNEIVEVRFAGMTGDLY